MARRGYLFVILLVVNVAYGINTTEDETSLPDLRSLSLHRESEVRHSTDPLKITEGSSSTLPPLAWEWTAGEPVSDMNNSLLSVSERQGSVSTIGVLVEDEYPNDQNIAPPSVREGQKSLSTIGSLVKADSVPITQIEAQSRVADKDESATLDDSLTTSVPVNVTLATTSSTTTEMELIASNTTTSTTATTAATEANTITTTPNIINTTPNITTTPEGIIITLTSDTNGHSITTSPKTTNTTTANTTTPDTTVTTITATSTTKDSIITADNTTTAIPFTSESIVNTTLTNIPRLSPATHTNTFDRNQRKLKSEPNEALSPEGKQNGLRKSTIHPPTQEQSIKAREYKSFPTPIVPMKMLRGFRKDGEEKKSENHSTEQERNITNQDSKNLLTLAGQEEYLRGHRQEEEKQHIAQVRTEEEESVTTNYDGEYNDEEEELKLVIRQLRSVLEGNHSKTHTSKSQPFEHSDSQMHYETLKNLWDMHRTGKGKKSGRADPFPLHANSSDSDKLFQMIKYLQKIKENEVKHLPAPPATTITTQPPSAVQVTLPLTDRKEETEMPISTDDAPFPQDSGPSDGDQFETRGLIEEVRERNTGNSAASPATTVSTDLSSVIMGPRMPPAHRNKTTDTNATGEEASPPTTHPSANDTYFGTLNMFRKVKEGKVGHSTANTASSTKSTTSSPPPLPHPASPPSTLATTTPPLPSPLPQSPPITTTDTTTTTSTETAATALSSTTNTTSLPQARTTTNTTTSPKNTTDNSMDSPTSTPITTSSNTSSAVTTITSPSPNTTTTTITTSTPLVAGTIATESPVNTSSTDTTTTILTTNVTHHTEAEASPVVAEAEYSSSHLIPALPVGMSMLALTLLLASGVAVNCIKRRHRRLQASAVPPSRYKQGCWQDKI